MREWNRNRHDYLILTTISSSRVSYKMLLWGFRGTSTVLWWHHPVYWLKWDPLITPASGLIPLPVQSTLLIGQFLQGSLLCLMNILLILLMLKDTNDNVRDANILWNGTEIEAGSQHDMFNGKKITSISNKILIAANYNMLSSHC